MTQRYTGSSVRADLTFSIVPTWLLDAEVSDGAVRLYAVLSQRADNDTGRCWPGRRALAERLRCSVDTVDRRLSELAEVGAVSIERRPAERDRNETNVYTVHRVPPEGGVGRTVAAQVGRTDAAERAAPMRPELDQVELDQEPIASEDALAPATPGAAAREHLGLSWTPSDVSARHGSLPDALRLCALFADVLRRRGVRVPEGRERSKVWVEPMEAVLRIDGRTPEQVERVVAWLDAGADRVSHFWQANVLSPTKLRERWDQMQQQYQRERSPRPSRSAAVLHAAGTGRSLLEIMTQDDEDRPELEEGR